MNVGLLGYGSCQEWDGTLDAKGYGRIWHEGRWALAHRVIYEREVGPIPDGLTLDHVCRNHACVNVDHLEPVTHRENVLRGEGPTAMNAAKTVCVRGHSLADAYVIPSSGSRRCRECHREDSRRRYREKAGVTPERMRV